MNNNIENSVAELWDFFKSCDFNEERLRSKEGIPFSYSITNSNMILIYCTDTFGEYQRCCFVKQQLIDILKIILSSEELLPLDEYVNMLLQNDSSIDEVSFLLPICTKLAEYNIDRQKKYEIHPLKIESDAVKTEKDAVVFSIMEEKIPQDELSQLASCKIVRFHPRMEAYYKKASKEIRKEINEVCNAFSQFDRMELEHFLQQKNNKRLHGINRKIEKIYMNHKSGHRLLWCNGSDIDEEKYKNEIILLGYVEEHDNQGSTAKRRSLDVLYEDSMNCADELIPHENKSKNNRTPLYKYNNGVLMPVLTEEQEKLLTIMPPALLIGGAGTGKTLISINLFYQFYKSKKEPVYITYTEQLTHYVIKQLSIMGVDKEFAYSHVFQLGDFYKELVDCNKKVIKDADFENFREWKEKRINRRKNASLYSINTWMAWTYIRGVIKGGAVSLNTPYLDKSTFVEWMQKKEGFNRYDAENIYQLSTMYYEHCKKENLQDDNDWAWEAYESNTKRHYEAVIIDEIQDLTYLQINAIIKATDVNAVYMCGDINQRINPTIINLDSIGSLFFKKDGSKKMQTYPLGNTFRIGTGIINFVNSISDLRREYVGNIDSFAESRVKSSRNYSDGMWVTLCDSRKIRMIELLDLVKNASNCCVIVPDTETKNSLLRNKPELEGRIQAVFESKGLEYENVIIINFLTKYHSEFEEILNYQLKRSTYARLLFNFLYVASTRAKDRLILFEENCSEKITDVIYSNVVIKDSIGDILRYISLREDDDGWYEEGRRLEEVFDYRSAQLAYEHVANKPVYNELERCDTMIAYNGIKQSNGLSAQTITPILSRLINNGDYDIAENIILKNSLLDDNAVCVLYVKLLYEQGRDIDYKILVKALNAKDANNFILDTGVVCDILECNIRQNDEIIERIDFLVKGMVNYG